MSLSKLAKRMGLEITPSSSQIFNPLDHAFEAQLRAIVDPAPFVALTCGGRAGKTTAAALKWHRTRLSQPGQASVFISLTRESAKKILWRELKRQNQEWALGLEFNESSLSVRDSLGSVLYLQGANKDDLVDVLRGIPFVLVMFDEAAFFRRGLLERCIEDAIQVRLFDYGGQCWVMSTPGLSNVGWFYRVSTGRAPGWSRHHWDMMSNPHLPKTAADKTPEERDRIKRAWVEAEMKRMGWTETSPTFMREYRGLWASDDDALVYPVHDANVIQQMPRSWETHRHEYITVMGIDYGVVNATAHAILAYHRSENTVYVVHSRRDVGMGPTDARQVSASLIDFYRPSDVVGDAGGLGKAYVVEANVRGGLNIEPADKLGKRGHQEYVRDALMARPVPRLLIVDNNPGNVELIDEMGQLPWEPFPKDDPRYRTREDPRGKKDICDAVLYAFMKCYSYFPLPRQVDNAVDPDDLPRDDGALRYLQ